MNEPKTTEELNATIGMLKTKLCVLLAEIDERYLSLIWRGLIKHNTPRYSVIMPEYYGHLLDKSHPSDLKEIYEYQELIMSADNVRHRIIELLQAQIDE